MRTTNWTSRLGATALLALAVLLLAAPGRAQAQDFPELSEQLEPLREQFNADAGKVRLILILDPT